MLNKIQAFEFLKGTGYTVNTAIIALLMGVILGIVLAFMRMSKNKIAKSASWLYLWIFRGTPLLLQLFVVVFALPILWKNIFNSPCSLIINHKYITVIVAYGINSAAYMAEFFRAGIESIDKGQIEASKALGMSYFLTMRKIIIPQSLKRLIPSVGNELIMLIKDTSLLATVGIFDLLRTAKTTASSTVNPIYFLYAAIIYLLLTSIIQVVFDKLEKKLSYYE